MFYAIPPSGVKSRCKTSLDLISLGRKQVRTYSFMGDLFYEMRCLFVAVGLNTHCIVLPHWDNMS